MAVINYCIFYSILISSALCIDSYNSTSKYNDENWYKNIFLLPIIFGTSSASTVRCKQQTELFMKELSEGKLWAVEMFDSSTKFPSGIVEGRSFDMGNFDECLKINRIPFGNTSIQGKYCSVKVQYSLKNDSWFEQDPYSLDFDLLGSVWEKLQYRGDIKKYRRDTLTMALCVPSGCEASDVETSLDTELRPLFDSRGIEVTINVESDECIVDEHKPITYSAVSFWLVFAGLLAISVGGMYEKLNSETNLVLNCFSLKRNMNALIKFKPMHPALDVMYAAKFGLMLFVIGGHLISQYYGFPKSDVSGIESIYGHRFPIYLVHGYVFLDSFFIMSAIISSYTLLNQLNKKSVNFLTHIILRYVRLIPSYMFVVFFMATAFYSMGNGPFWNKYIGLEQTRCRTSWWSSLVLIHNYYDSANMCTFPAWYLACDFHLFVIGTIIIFLYAWKTTIGLSVLIVLTVFSVFLSFYETLKNEADPFYFFKPGNDDMRNDAYFLKYYIQTHYRATSYLIGLMVGILFHKVKRRQCIPEVLKPKLVSPVLSLCWVVAFWTGLILWTAQFLSPGKPYIYTPFASAVYSSLNRVVFGISAIMIWMMFTYGDMGFLYRLCISRPLIVLGRITYGVFISHVLPYMYSKGIQRSPKDISVYSFLETFITTTILSFAVGLLLTLLIELPCRNLANLYFRKHRHESRVANYSIKP